LKITHNEAVGKWLRIFELGLENYVLLVKKIAFFNETPEDKYEAETISIDYLIFSDF
jgi:hypothetical protein